MAVIAKLRPDVDAFFEKVTVNVPAADRRENRLKLLNEIREATRAVAGVKLVFSRQHAETDELGPELVAERDPCGRRGLGLEGDPLDGKLGRVADAGRREGVGFGLLRRRSRRRWRLFFGESAVAARRALLALASRGGILPSRRGLRPFPLALAVENCFDRPHVRGVAQPLRVGLGRLGEEESARRGAGSTR